MSKLTGISTATLRVWESRYGVVIPSRRDSGHREYSDSDVAKLKLVQRLVSHGERIGNIANLDEPVLLERISRFEDSNPVANADNDSTQFFVVSPDEAAMSRTLAAAGILRNGSAANLAAATAHFDTQAINRGLFLEVDSVVVTEADAILALARRAGDHPVVLLCRHIASRLADQLVEANVIVVRKPVTPSTLRDVLQNRGLGGNGSYPIEDDVPAPIYDRRLLKKVSAMSSSIQCECPQHLSEILASLNGFEEYSATCEDRSAEDAELHAYLRRVSGKARVLMEQALARTLKVEGIDPMEL